MNKAHTVEINGVGIVLFERSKRARHVIIYIKPLTGVRVAVPDRLSFKKAEEFVHAKITWIQKHLKRIKQYERVNGSVSGSSTGFNRTQARTKLIKRLEVHTVGQLLPQEQHQPQHYTHKVARRAHGLRNPA
jgi:predicted metal-dependent hydrolase